MKDVQPQWKVHLPNLLGEILNNQGCSILKIPLNITARLLNQVADRAIQLDDPELNKLMMRLALYSIADPDSEDYDPDFINRYQQLTQQGDGDE